MFAAIPLAFIIPPLCYIRLEAGSLTSLAKIPAILLASFGIIVTTKGAIDIFTNVCHLTIKSRAFTFGSTKKQIKQIKQTKQIREFSKF